MTHAHTINLNVRTGELELSGNTWPIRHGLRANGGRWLPASKSWGFKDTSEAREFLRGLAQLPDEKQAEKAPEATPEATPEGTTGTSAVDKDTIARMIADALVPHAGRAGEHAVRIKGLDKAIERIDAALKTRRVETIELQPADGEKRTVEGLAHEMLPTLIKSLDARLHVWIAGPSGSGKTHGAQQAAEALGLRFELQGAMTMAHELTGFVDAGGQYHETPFIRAFRDGGLILLDELDAGSNEALLALNAALANGLMSLPSGEQVKAHSDFRCIGAANTFGAGATQEYVGRTRIDAAFLQRFGARITWGYDEELEMRMSGNAAWCERVQRARQRAQREGLKVLITPRASQAGAKLIAGGMTPDEAARLTFLADLSPAQCELIGEVK